MIDYILVRLHLTSSYLPWLASDRWALVGVIIPTVWKFYPFFCLLILGGLQVVPPEYYEAAQLDGAGSWKQFAHITWAIRPMAFFAVVLGIVGMAFGEFSIIYPMTGGGPGGSTQTLGIYMYNQAFQLFHMGYASALGVVMFGICIVLVLAAYPRLQEDAVALTSPIVRAEPQLATATVVRKHDKRTHHRLRQSGLTAGATIACVVLLFPVYWLVVSSFEPMTSLLTRSLSLVHTPDKCTARSTLRRSSSTPCSGGFSTPLW